MLFVLLIVMKTQQNYPKNTSLRTILKLSAQKKLTAPFIYIASWQYGIYIPEV